MHKKKIMHDQALRKKDPLRLLKTFFHSSSIPLLINAVERKAFVLDDKVLITSKKEYYCYTDMFENERGVFFSPEKSIFLFFLETIKI
jgi:hypothetical protein